MSHSLYREACFLVHLHARSAWCRLQGETGEEERSPMMSCVVKRFSALELVVSRKRRVRRSEQNKRTTLTPHTHRRPSCDISATTRDDLFLADLEDSTPGCSLEILGRRASWARMNDTTSPLIFPYHCGLKMGAGVRGYVRDCHMIYCVYLSCKYIRGFPEIFSMMNWE